MFIKMKYGSLFSTEASVDETSNLSLLIRLFKSVLFLSFLDSKNVKKCQKDFVWQTMVACSKKSGSQSDTDCKMFHPILDQVKNLN